MTGVMEETGVEGLLRWQAVLARDARYDGAFVYAVRSTGVYCRPSCPSKRPLFKNVRLFAGPDAAEQAGFRACLRCHPRQSREAAPEAALVVAACRDMASQEDGVQVAQLAASLGVSPARLTGAFQRVLGVTPRQYAEALQMERLKVGLRNGGTVTGALYDAGYSSPSRVYERANRLLGMTPRTYRDGGKGMHIIYAVAPSVAGRVLVGVTEKGVCAVQLGSEDAELESTLTAMFPQAQIARDDGGLRDCVRQVLTLFDAPAPAARIPLDIQATAFQRRVWDALRNIPFGETRTYGQVAESIGQPSAVRAVARACASNPVAIVVPCHRVVPAAGGTGGYRWGSDRKVTILEHERGEGRRETSSPLTGED